MRSTDDLSKAQALEAERAAAMLSICAAAFSVDALYASLTERAPELRSSGKRKGTKRSRQVGEVLRLVSGKRLSNADARSVFAQLDLLFDVRDWAVHPPADFREPVLHPDLGTGAEWRYTTYTSVSAATRYIAWVR